jgi:molybdopterin-guanine dinucleotide biosynthesis protein A
MSHAAPSIASGQITGLLLAGGRGQRMGGVDKGLQHFNGTPLAMHVLARLQVQVGQAMISANRNLADYAAFGVPVWSDTLTGHAGPLAGFLTGLEHCASPYLLTVPCDSPLFPLDLAHRLGDALVAQQAEIAMASACEPVAAAAPVDVAIPTPARQPVFCLLRASLRESLLQFTRAGGRKIGAWTAQHRTVLVPFDRPSDAPDAFFNANTLDELRAFESR